MNKFAGVGVALITPFDKSGAVDFEALGRLLTHTAAVDYYVVLGTTAESATMNTDERNAVVAYVVKENAARKPIVVGIGGNNTLEVIANIEKFDLSGVDAILSVVPYYNKPNQVGIYEHFAAILKASKLPIILYNVPGRTGVNMTAETTLKLANEFRGKAIAIKEASGCASQAAYILRDKPADFAVISGDDNMTLPLMALGIDGVISVSANAFAPLMVDMVRAAQGGDFAKAREVSLKLHEITDMLFAEGNPAGVKCVLKHKNVINNYLRLPLVPVSASLESKIIAEIEKRSL